MTTTQQLVSGLGGAIGSDFIATQNRLVFTEFDGKISRYDLVRSLRGTSSLSLVTGASLHTEGGHIRWLLAALVGSGVMQPEGECMLAYLGHVNYNAVGYADLQHLTYSKDSLVGAPGPGNQLADGAVFAVYNRATKTAPFDYAKVQVVSYGATIKLQLTSYQLRPAYQVLGRGYDQPEDVKVSADGQHAYVTERTSALALCCASTSTTPTASMPRWSAHAWQRPTRSSWPRITATPTWWNTPTLAGYCASTWPRAPRR